MIQEFETITFQLLKPGVRKDTTAIFDPLTQFDPDAKAPADVARSLNAAFLILLAGRKHPAYDQAHGYLTQEAESTNWKDVARFYLAGLEGIRREIQDVCNHDRDFANRLKYLAKWLQNTENNVNVEERREKIWSVFFPEAVGLFDESRKAVKKLRIKRSVKILQPHSKPINDPAREILFTSNAPRIMFPPLRREPNRKLCRKRMNPRQGSGQGGKQIRIVTTESLCYRLQRRPQGECSFVVARRGQRTTRGRGQGRPGCGPSRELWRRRPRTRPGGFAAGAYS